MSSEKRIPAGKRRAAHVAPVHTQLAALCHRKGKDGAELLLVTSSEGRWILPKGWPIDGLTGGEVARVEAWEEAGVKKGKVARKSLGSFIGTKLTKQGDEEPCLTRVYEIEVTKVVDDFPESDRRDRIWVSPAAAAEMVTEDGLRDLLRRL